MKKILGHLYFFSKLSTSFILLLSILIFGYFFYLSFKSQENSNNDQVNFLNRLNNNAENLIKLSKQAESTDITLIEIKKAIQNFSNKNESNEIILINNKIEELNLKMENILSNLKEIQSIEISKTKEIKMNDNSSTILDKNKTELSELIIFKFENNLDFTEELTVLQKLNDQSKQYIFEKINLIELKNFRGNTHLKNTFFDEVDFYLKEKYNNSGNFITKSLMKFISIEPSKINIIKNNEIDMLNDIVDLIDKKKYIISYNKLINITNYEKYFDESIHQINISIEFKELMKKVS